MKINLKQICIVTVILFALCGLVTCVDQTVLTLGTSADLRGLSIGDVVVPVGSIPRPISSNVWDSESFSVSGEEFSGIQFNKESDITNARIRPIVSKGATSEWGIGTKSNCPPSFSDTRVPVTFESDEFIYIKVVSEDKATTNYYRFSTTVYSTVTDLASVTIAGRITKSGKAGETGGGVPNENWESAVYPTDSECVVNITTKEAQGALIEAATFDPNSTVRYARTEVVDGRETTPEFTAPETPLTFKDQDFLYVEVIAQNTIDKKYYKLRVNVGRMTSISTLKFTTVRGEVELYGLGLPNLNWRNVGPGSYATASVDQPAAGFGIDIKLDDDMATYQYQVMSGPLGTTAPAGLTGSGGGTTTPFRNGDFLVIRVNPENVASGVTSYYHIRVTLLAANIKTQPQSGWYYKDDPAKPLTIEFADGTDTTGFTYQWYEADSLFGIYGRHGMNIDEKNNISTINGGPDMYYYLVQPGIQQYGKPINPAGDKLDPKYLEELAWEADVSRGARTAVYTPRTDWEDVPIRLPSDAGQNTSYPAKPSLPTYDTDYDPKVSDPYKLGRNLTAKAATDENGEPIYDEDHKPVILYVPPPLYPAHGDNKVNFFTGSTSEVRYYWVVVTRPDGLTVTSDRAVILTETDRTMEHYIFELSKLPRKNVKPFAKKRELYQIELSDFDYPRPKDPRDPTKELDLSQYEFCIAQAQYYLPDGRPWTQNWTHGDMHFGYTEGKPGYIANENSPLTWWHNNLGSNSGAIPLQTPHSAQGGLAHFPDWIGFAPSGDPDRGLPPNDPATGQLPVGYKPEGYKPEGAAQGYFCGFIELMELRFARKIK
jgi:hypothetical protein